MPPSQSRLTLEQINLNAKATIQSAMDVFMDVTKSDTETMNALHSAGSTLANMVSQLPLFIGGYGQFFGGKTELSLQDIGASLQDSYIVPNTNPTEVAFTGYGNLVGPYNGMSRFQALKDAIYNYRAAIDAQEANSPYSGDPSFPGEGDPNQTMSLYIPN
jgi:hypothetical protein